MTDPPDGRGPEAAPAQARALRRLVTRHAVDTRPLAIAPYRATAGGQGTAFVGSMLTQVAVPVQIYALTRSSLYVGFVGLAGLLPIVIFGICGGAIADAVDRRRLYFWASIGSWVVTISLLLQTLLDLRNVGLILALVVVQSAIEPDASPRSAPCPLDLVGRRACRARPTLLPFVGPQLGQLDNMVAAKGTLTPDEVANAIGFTVSRPRQVKLRQVIVLPTHQALCPSATR